MCVCVCRGFRGSPRVHNVLIFFSRPKLPEMKEGELIRARENGCKRCMLLEWVLK